MTHDFAAQKAETMATFAEMQAEHGLPDEADVDYFLVPNSRVPNANAETQGPDWRALADDLTRQGYDCAWIEDDGDVPYLVATLPDQAISASGIWFGEEVATRAALTHGFLPDGWGLLGGDAD